MSNVEYTHHDRMDLAMLDHLPLRGGGRVCLIGPGGAGKSALMMHLCSSHAERFEHRAYIVGDSSALGTFAEGLANCLAECWDKGAPDHISEHSRRALGRRFMAPADPMRDVWSRIMSVLFLDWVSRRSARGLFVFDNAEGVAAVDALLQALPLSRSDLPSASTETSVIEAGDIASAIAPYPPFTVSGTANMPWATDLADTYLKAAKDPIFTSGTDHIPCHVVVVTNSAKGAGGWPCVAMLPFDADLGAKILANHAADASLLKDPDTLALVADLGGLPVALAQAGRTISAGAYSSVKAYRADLARALQHEVELAPVYDDISQCIQAHPNVAATMSLAQDRLLASLASDDLRNAAREVWSICSALPAARLPGRLFDAVCGSEERRQEILDRLVDFFWLALDPQGDRSAPAYRMHRVHRAVFAGVPTADERSELNDKVVRAVSAALQDPSKLRTQQERTDFNDLYDHAVYAAGLVASDLCPDAHPRPFAERICEDDQLTEALVTKLAHICHDPDSGQYDLASFVQDLRVQTWLHRGYWHALLTNKAADRLDYDDMYSLETTEGLDKLKRACASLWRAEHGAAMVAATCMFFATHYWWPEYIPEDHICRPVLDELLESAEAAPEDNHRSERLELLAALQTVYDRYPPSYWYEARTTTRKADWEMVEDALLTIRRLLRIEAVEPSVAPAMSAAGRMYARGITDLYLASALRYTRDRHYPVDDKGTELYEDAERCLNAAHDEMHLEWCVWERADAATEAVKFHARRRHGWVLRRGDLERCIAQAEKDLARCHDEASRGERIDYEIIAEAYDSMGDIRWLHDRRPEAWGFHCAAAVSGAAFLTQDQDNYSLHLYREMRNKLMARIREVADASSAGENEALAVCRFLYAFWNGVGLDEVRSFETVFLPLTDRRQAHVDADLRRAILLERAEFDLLPPVPRLADIEAEANDPTNPASMRWLAGMRGLLIALPGHVASQTSSGALDGYPLPDGFAGFLEWLSTRMAAAETGRTGDV